MNTNLTTEEWITISESLTILTKNYNEKDYISFITYGFGESILESIDTMDIIEGHELFLASMAKLHSIAIQDQEFLLAKKIIEVCHHQTKLVEDILLTEQNTEYLEENVAWITAIRDYLPMIFQENVTKNKNHK